MTSSGRRQVDERAGGDGEDGETARATRVKSCNGGEADGERHKIENKEMETRWESLHRVQPADDLHVSARICAPTAVILVPAREV